MLHVLFLTITGTRKREKQAVYIILTKRLYTGYIYLGHLPIYFYFFISENFPFSSDPVDSACVRVQRAGGARFRWTNFSFFF